MIVFVDESGDAGLKLDQGSSHFFVLCMLLFNDPEEANRVESRIKLLRHELSLSPKFEFHFSKLKGQIRKAFLQAVSPYDFQIFGVVINKGRLYGEGFKSPDTFWKYISKLTLTHVKPYLENAKFVIDGRGDRKFKQQLTTYLKRHGNSKAPGSVKKIKKVAVEASCRNDLLQLADMVVGALARKYREGNRATEEYWQIIRHSAIYIQEWPK